MCFKCCSVKQQKIWIFIISSLLLILGIVLLIAWPTLSEQIVNSMLPLTPTSTNFPKWVVTPIPLYFNFYMFNWTNPHMANDSSVKPNFEELGPYVFREVKFKEDLVWDNERNLVTYFGRRTWYFQESKSNGSLEDMITAPHLPTVGGAKIFNKLHPIVRKIMNYAFNREGGKLAMTQTVRNWIFDGFYDDIMDFATRLHSPILNLKENHFAYFNKRNGSKEAEGTFTIHTGKNNLEQMGDLKYWNDLNRTRYWEGECGRVNGSTGELWAPAKKWHDPVSVFFSDIYRYLNMYPQTNESYRGIEARRYTSTELTFDNGNKAEDTKCFCVKGRECPKNGLIDFSPTAFGAPLYLSHPHFYMADPLYRENTTGLNPDSEKHGIYLLLEPKLGIPLDIDGRLMISVLVERDEHIDLFKDLAWNFYAPLFWAQIQTSITDELLMVVKFTLNLPQIGQYCGIVLTIIGAITIGIGVYITQKHK